MLPITVAVSLLALASCGSGDSGDSGSSSSPTGVPTTTAPEVVCASDLSEAGAPTDGALRRMVDDLIDEARLPEAEPYDEFKVVCDNTGVTTLEAPVAFTDVEPAPGGPPATAIRVSPDFHGLVEEAPITNVFVAAVGGGTFPTQPALATVIRQSADGSLSSGTRDPREGETITDDCQALPTRDFTTGTYSGKARFFVNCGDAARAWVLLAAAPTNGDSYFFQIVAQVLTTADAEALGQTLNTLTIDAETLTQVAEQTDPAPEATTTTVAGTATTAAP